MLLELPTIEDQRFHRRLIALAQDLFAIIAANTHARLGENSYQLRGLFTTNQEFDIRIKVDGVNCKMGIQIINANRGQRCAFLVEHNLEDDIAKYKSDFAMTMDQVIHTLLLICEKLMPKSAIISASSTFAEQALAVLQD
ncbi:hypothetical protein COV81_01495 [Candidatus Peregrinibacteria bacterium CG11_big_fil_rev_8_21_14_0_20_41_10]|nr:MAG: hypothetical protein COV81_01495 [Candidatus Peregrinibacteria bacterium CG11_big_fil_rev_8_21_14_0_20_41_10]PIZ74060.1 MAG: hypothetical protein COY06_04700 [Candidatus Peregrinibacteria bacterium CG_4_10_14_0_2_um_filter_41_8]PJC37801.1 MAG: hypothetical protein CO045_03615 [Candidatus Peregrinibacteria bacterium CG_4_9_14_0_2_um_filter_41_14]